jgi:hypothetical protein
MLPHWTHVKVANRPAKRKEKRSGDAPVSSSQRFGNQRLDRWAKGICAIRDQDASAIVDGRNGVRICGPAAAAAVKDQIPGTTIEVASDMDVSSSLETPGKARPMRYAPVSDRVGAAFGS